MCLVTDITGVMRKFVIMILKYARVYKYVTLPKCESINFKQCNRVMRPLALVFIEESCLMRLNMVEVLDHNGDGCCSVWKRGRLLL